jgi:hypothetical protein
MSEGDDVDHNIFKAKYFLIESEYGSEDYHLAYKTLMLLLKKEADDGWKYLQQYFTNKQECAYISLIDRLIYIDEDDPEIGDSAEVVAKFLMADSQLLEYCKAQLEIDNECEFRVKRNIKIGCKLDRLRDAIHLTEKRI